MNSGPFRADTRDVRHATDSYFVRLGGESHLGHGPDGQSAAGRAGLGAPGTTKRRHHRRRGRGKAMLVILLVVGLGSWTYWASQRPGGVSGTVHGWINHVRGDVDSISTDPDLATARRFYNGQYVASGRYPQMGESDLAAAGIGVGVTVDWCGPQAVVIQGTSGGGTSSRLLLSGHDLGELKGQFECPTDLADPAPWKAP